MADVRHSLVAMELTFERDFRSINDPQVSEGELPDLVVLTGPNGSGKSNLLEAIFNGSIRVAGVDMPPQNPQQMIRHFPIGQLAAQAGGAVTANEITDTANVLHNAFNSILDEISRGGVSAPPGHADKRAFHNQYLRNRLSENHGWPTVFLADLERAANKPLIDFTFDNFRHYAPTTINQDAFSLSIAEAFTRYHKRYIENKLIQLQIAENEDPGMVPQTNEQFRERNGLPPWDQINELLTSLDLSYRINRPVGMNPNVPYDPRLIRLDNETEIRVEELSSGERTLMALVMSLYTGSALQPGSIFMPQVLLFDEPDASLHPSMVTHLLRVIRETFVNGHRVKVILTTHSPTTVALASEESLYVMRADSLPRVVKVSRDQALASLLVGVPTLSVSNDHRRLVFVEAPDDQLCYQELFTTLRPSIGSPFSLVFAPSGTLSDSNNYKVKQLVSTLRDNGIDALGIIDRDNGLAESPVGIFSTPERYALENLVLDPVCIALLIVRDGHHSAEEVFGVDLPYFEIAADHAQAGCDFVVSKLRQQMSPIQKPQIDVGEPVVTAYVGGAQVTVPSFVMNYRGHDLEEKLLLEAFPELKSYKGQLKAGAVKNIYTKLSQWIPQAVQKLFEELLESHGPSSVSDLADLV